MAHSNRPRSRRSPRVAPRRDTRYLRWCKKCTTTDPPGPDTRPRRTLCTTPGQAGLGSSPARMSAQAQPRRSVQFGNMARTLFCPRQASHRCRMRCSLPCCCVGSGRVHTSRTRLRPRYSIVQPGRARNWHCCQHHRQTCPLGMAGKMPRPDRAGGRLPRRSYMLSHRPRCCTCLLGMCPSNPDPRGWARCRKCRRDSPCRRAPR